MDALEIRDTDAAREFVVQSLWLQRVLKPSAETVRNILEWCMEVSSSGAPLPPPGFVADCGHLIFGVQTEIDTDRLQLPSVSPGLIREYEDYVLGKLYADSSFERGSDALAHYGNPRDRAKGLAFLLTQMAEQTEYSGVILSPGVIRELDRSEPADILAEGWKSLTENISPYVEERYQALIKSVHGTGETLASEDVFELEHGTALAGFGPRVALRQVLRSARQFTDTMPVHHTPGKSRHLEVATHILDEDTYPIGGFTSISNRGTVESLLQSQLSYMETDPNERPDLFDIKFLRDELLYYSRDENQFFRRRRTYIFVLHSSLAEARVKDADLPWQRIILILGLVRATIDRLFEWLSDESLQFQIVVPPAELLAGESEILKMVFREQIENGSLEILELPMNQLSQHCESFARRSLCHAITISQTDLLPAIDDVLLTRLVVGQSVIQIGIDADDLTHPHQESASENWATTALCLLQSVS